MHKYKFSFTEVSYGVVEVFADSEAEAREIAECEGCRFVHNSNMEVGEVCEVWYSIKND